MKINKIEYRNFRNFKEPGEIVCSTDGKVTIIYGKNGDGKTTLHQLFRWIFYGEINFNETATKQLYNLEFESESKFGDSFEVMGRVEFEDNGFNYSLTRIAYYKKGLDGSHKEREEQSLLRRDADNNWKPLTEEEANFIIEDMLPIGLADYFFFDGESMIADLRVKEADSAKNLRKALFSMFKLDTVEAAISHLGKEDRKTTVLGNLYLSKGAFTTDKDIATLKSQIESLETKMENLEEDVDITEANKKEYKNRLNEISENIGKNKSKQQYEMERKDLKKN